ncbi:uncharacterized protein LOC106012186 [Aplysia californica]|uniref:Uncharacterized protein LOC106012186 n=1 Tax=Aplysia californica TaxID=6500 RepID=A0ABM1A2Y5_APLCA|nr:uncharacterized protein LOC106012186 [Aplysia californica]
MNASDWSSNSSSVPSSSTLSPSLLPPAANPSVASAISVNVTDVTAAMSEKPCGEALSSQTPAPVRLPGSLDALLYIVIVLMFYAFSIVVLMVKYIRREREEANLRNYYHEFVSRDKFRSAQYKNRQFMSRIFGRGGGKNKQQGVVSIEDEENSELRGSSQNSFRRNRGQAQTITRKGNTFSRLLVECDDDDNRTQKEKESFTFLSAKNQFCRNGFFGKKFCNKQLCSKCVSESAPSIDWCDGKGAVEKSTNCTNADLVEVTLHNCSSNLPSYSLNSSQRPRHCEDIETRYSLERDNHTFLPIMECDSEKELEDMVNNVVVAPVLQAAGGGGEAKAWADREAQAYLEEHALVSSCSLEVSELLANMPPLGADGSIDMDTLDGLSNLDSEAESQSLLNYSNSLRGSDCRSYVHSSNSLRRSPRKMHRLNSSESNHSHLCRFSPKALTQNDSSSNKNGDIYADDRARDLSDVLSERTSLLSCTLSIAEADDDDAHTNHSSSKHFLPNGFTCPSNTNGKIKPPELKNSSKHDLKSNGKSVLNSLSKSISSEEEDVMKLLNDITLLTDDSGVFRNLKYFLRSFSRNDEEKDIAVTHDKPSALPKETYFGPDSPKSVVGNSEIGDSVPAFASCNGSVHDASSRLQCDLDSVDEDQIPFDSSEKDYGNRWGYTYDEEDDLFSDRSSSVGQRSSSFGDYCMGQASESQTIDLSKPLVRRQLDSDTKAGLSRAFIGLGDPWLDDLPIHKPNPMVAGYGPARKETKV